MHVRALDLPGAWLFSPTVFEDARGHFSAPFQAHELEAAVGRSLDVRQGNTSLSVRGVVRGLHYADVPPGQAKFVQCVAGAVMDVAVDLRVGSPTFGRWDAVRLDSDGREAVFLDRGLGHGFVALTETATVNYLSSTAYDPAAEHGIDPLDPEVGIPWREWVVVGELVLSEKDRTAPALARARGDGLLPHDDECRGR